MMRGLTSRDMADCDPDSPRLMLRRAMAEWPALLWFTPLLGMGIWLTCRC